MANLPVDQREYLQHVLSTREQEVSELLKAQENDMAQKSDNRQESELNYVYAFVKETLGAADNLSDFGTAFWEAVKTLASTKDPKYIELFSTLFEVAKRMPDNIRIDVIYLVGTYLYRLKKVRLDPVNEVEYLDSLVAKGRPFRALGYWSSRKNREEVKETTYWTEIGALYHLDAGLWHEAELLALSLHEKGLLSPRLAGEMVKFAAKKQNKALGLWTDRFISSLKGNVKEDVSEVSSLEEILHRVTPITPENAAQVLYNCVEARQWDTAAKLLKVLPQHYDNAKLLSSMSRTTKYTSKSEPPIHDFAELLTDNSDMLFQEKFWAAWLCALARTGEEDQVVEVLHQLDKFKVHLTADSAANLVYTLLRRDKVSVGEQVASMFAQEPLVNAVLLRYYASNDVEKVQPFLNNLKCTITAPLAASILEVGNPTNLAETELGLDDYCWRLIWAAVRDKKLDRDCRQLFGHMLSTGNYKATMGLVENVSQAFVSAEQDIVGAAAAIAYFERHLGFSMNPLLAASIFQLVVRVMQGRPLLFARTSRKEINAHLGEVSLSQFLVQLSRRAARKITESDIAPIILNWEGTARSK